MKIKMKEWIKENYLAVIMTAAAITYVLIVSFFNDLGLSPDSTNYLAEAKAILMGNGFNIHKAAGYDSFYGIWPIGFPALIALVSFITGLDVLYAAKVIMVCIYILTAYMFIKRFGRYAWVYLLFFANPGYIYCMRYVSSENLFLFAVLFFSFCTYDFWSDSVNDNRACIMLGISNIFAFLSRWVGAYTFAIMGLLAVLCFFGITMDKNRKKAIKLGGITLLNGCILLSYLMIIKAKTGYMTGMYRIPSEEPRPYLIDALVRAENMEVNDVFAGLFSVNIEITAVIYLCIFAYLIYKLIKEGFKDKLTYSLTASSIVYWLGYVYTRFHTDMEIFNFRVLLPATLPLFVAVIHCIMQNERIRRDIDRLLEVKWKRMIVCMVLVSMMFELHNSPRLGYLYNPYKELKQTIHERYDEIPSGSLVMTEDWCINFLRPDLLRTPVFDCDSAQLKDIREAMNSDRYENVYVSKEYLLYLLSGDDAADYGDLFLLAEKTDTYLIKLK